MSRRLAIHPWAIWLFTQLWQHRLYECCPACGGPPARVLRIKGWRTALVENRWGQRSTVEWL